jgi:phosphoribosylglycinamide formyltransferase-1
MILRLLKHKSAMAIDLSNQRINSCSFNLVVCASGGGGNFQAIIDSQALLGIRISCLIVDRQCGAIDRAVRSGIPCIRLDKESRKSDLFSHFSELVPPDTSLIVLAGFMPILPPAICEAWSGRIINTHPSLLPKYGGKGMYGVKVQEAVLAAKEVVAGCTVHFVDSQIDSGAIILQKSINVDPKETAWQLGSRVFLEENRLLVEAIKILKLAITSGDA